MGTKQEIEKLINENEFEAAKEAMDRYEKISPFDVELLSLKTAYNMGIGDYNAAYGFAKEAVKRVPLNGELQYNYAVLSEIMGDYFEAYIAYGRAAFLFRHNKDENGELLNADESKMEVLNKLVAEAKDPNLSPERATELFDGLSTLEKMESTSYGLSQRLYSGIDNDVIGSWIYDNISVKRYVGAYKDQYLNSRGNGHIEYRDIVRVKGEFIAAETGKNINVDDKENEYLVPIATEGACYISFTENDKEMNVLQYRPCCFYHYRVKGGTQIRSNVDLIYGRSIPIKSDQNKKKLVLSIFVDGLSYSIIKGEKFKENMPYTYEYFRKGMIFDNAYNTGEWTYPSIASYVCSLDTTHHMLFHNLLDYPMPETVPTIAETFHDNGFYTTKYCGNWRIIPGYGHARGYDRFVYQHQSAGFKVHEVIADAINQIDAAKDLNHYMWISIGDLHDVADKFNLPINVQKELPISNRVFHETGETSVKQKFNPDDKVAYLKMAKHIDNWLHILFSHIEEVFSPDDVVVSLFSDHGQGYLIEREDAHFLASERSNIPMMFRGGLAEGKGYCEETVSALDYAYMLRNIAGIPNTEVKTDGQLPLCLGGETKREYAYTESIHPGDPYQAAIFAPDECVSFFFTNGEPVLNDGRFWLKEYEYWLEDLEGNRIDNKEESEYYLSIVKDHIAPILMYE